MEEESGDEGEIEEEPSDLSTNQLVEAPQAAVLFVSTMVGFCPPNSLKFRGKIKSKEMVVLIDSEASDNFISKTLVKDLGLTRLSTRDFKVQMGNGDKVSSTKYTKGFGCI